MQRQVSIHITHQIVIGNQDIYTASSLEEERNDRRMYGMNIIFKTYLSLTLLVECRGFNHNINIFRLSDISQSQSHSRALLSLSQSFRNASVLRFHANDAYIVSSSDRIPKRFNSNTSCLFMRKNDEHTPSTSNMRKQTDIHLKASINSQDNDNNKKNININTQYHGSSKTGLGAFRDFSPPSSITSSQLYQAISENAQTPSKFLPSRSNLELFFNLSLLVASFGFAFYTVFNVDAGMTRGWTQEEILARVPFDNWRGYEESLADKPILTKTSINVIIYLLGDWLSQTIFSQKNALDFDASRTFKNGFIGLCFGPLVHAYYEFSDEILPPAIAVNRVYKIFMDQTIYLGTKCSIYIASVGLLNGESIQDVTDSVKTRIKPIMLTAWKFWPLVHCVTYGVIPARHRILWVNSVDLIWNAILAQAARGANEDEEEHKNIQDINVEATTEKDGSGKTNESQGEKNIEDLVLTISLNNTHKELEQEETDEEDDDDDEPMQSSSDKIIKDTSLSSIDVRATTAVEMIKTIQTPKNETVPLL